jgi:glutaredoxin/glutathione-dependent peroxiredoxin
MTIKQGDTLPSMKLMAAGPEGPRETTTDEVFRGRKVVMFAVPGAFTPTCSARHLPGFAEHAAEFAQRGIDQIVCLAVNDPFVLAAWAKSQGIGQEILMLADGSALFTRAMGLELDLTARGLGVRSQRYALLADDMKVVHLAVEKPGDFDVSSAEAMLEVV